ncbi:MAG: asparagine synthase-related protein [Myxococcota bacterium]|nr:asparagine synthase-related protein [Myxococcota bacterium]
MTAAIGIYRPGNSRSNDSWIQSLRDRRIDEATGAGQVYSEAGGDFMALLQPEAFTAPSWTQSSRQQAFMILAGRESGRPGAKSGVAARFDSIGFEAFSNAAGPFVSVVFEPQAQRLHLIRPMAGQRALFGAPLEDGLIFSTDAFWITSHPDFDFSLDAGAVGDYLSTGVIWGERTLSKGIRRILPGSTLTFNAEDRSLSTEDWAHYPAGTEIAKPDDAIDALDEVLGQAMQRTHSNPAPQALCLSAGLDSRTLLAIAAHQGIEMDCVTSGVEGSSELRLTERMCDALQARHMKCFFGSAFASDLERYASEIARVTQGEADFMNMMMLFQGIEFRSQFGLNSAIRGHGGELMKLNDAYGFSVRPETADSQDHESAKTAILGQLRGSAALNEARSILKGDCLEALKTHNKPSFDAAYDRLAGHSAHVGQAISLLFLTQYNGRHTVNAVRCMMQKIDVSQPMLDEDVISVLLQMPIALRSDTHLQRELLRRNQPALLKIPNSALGISLEASAWTTRAARLVHRIKTRLGLAREEIPEQWLRARMGQTFQSVLLDDRALSRPHIEAEALRALVDRSLAGDIGLNTLLGRLTILELMLRQQP